MRCHTSEMRPKRVVADTVPSGTQYGTILGIWLVDQAFETLYSGLIHSYDFAIFHIVSRFRRIYIKLLISQIFLHFSALRQWGHTRASDKVAVFCSYHALTVHLWSDSLRLLSILRSLRRHTRQINALATFMRCLRVFIPHLIVRTRKLRILRKEMRDKRSN